MRRSSLARSWHLQSRFDVYFMVTLENTPPGFLLVPTVAPIFKLSYPDKRKLVQWILRKVASSTHFNYIIQIVNS